VLGRQPVTVCARVWMFHKSAKLKAIHAANAGAEARPRSPIRLRGCITTTSTIYSGASVHCGVVVSSTSKNYERPKSEKLHTCHI